MAEAEAVLACELRLSGRISSRRTSAAARRHLSLLRCERLHGAAVEDLTLDRATLEHPPLGRVELVQACASSKRKLAGTSTPAPASAAIASISAMKRVAPAATAILAQLLRHGRSDQAGRVLSTERLPPHRHGQEGRLSSNSGRAMQTTSSGAPLESSTTCSTRSRNVCSPH